jgi:hypothetical protein
MMVDSIYKDFLQHLSSECLCVCIWVCVGCVFVCVVCVCVVYGVFVCGVCLYVCVVFVLSV